MNWFDGSGEELIRELLQDESIASPQQVMLSDASDTSRESIINKLISTVYSGPTISDIESALYLTSPSSLLSDARFISQSIFSMPDRTIGKTENKYTLRIKACGNGLADDGYKWRKYGQKTIKNSPHPRSYYRCTNPRCSAKKQVERSTEDSETLVVTYEGLHLHYTYSHFLLSRSQNYPAALQSAKKHKNQTVSDSDEVHDKAIPKKTINHSPENLIIREENSQTGLFYDCMQSSQGLLEDVVPLLVRKPCNSTVSSNENYHSIRASPLPYSSLSWTSDSSYHELGLLSSIL